VAVLGTVAFILLWLTVLVFNTNPVLDRLGLLPFGVIVAVPIVALVAMAGILFYKMPKCPHCGIRLAGPLLSTAVATGICGRCGRSIAD
jgi:hypothetical protein